MENILKGIKNLHFVGIGGSGMCPMAEILLSAGYRITGSDISQSDTLERIKSYGVKVFMGHHAENVEGADMLVYTAAAKQDNPEIVAAKEKGIPVYERSVVLGELTKQFKKSIAVSGTHGKTTTTAMVTQVLIESNFDPSAVIGGKLPLIGGNGRAGKSDYMVCEACEYVDTFLQLFPTISLILNLEADHLDYFKTFDNMKNSFSKFAKQTKEIIVVNGGDKDALNAVINSGKKIITFGFTEDCDYSVSDLTENKNICDSFTLMHKNEPICKINLSVPGKHNTINAIAAAAACHTVGVPADKIALALSHFKGVHRRFEVLGTFDGITVADDFAHHPTELTAILSSTAKMGFSNVWAIFQPHTYSRTYLLLDDFAKALSIPEHLVMTEILAVREENIYGIDIKDLENKVEGSCHFSSFEEIANHVIKNAKEGDLIITLGGGDIYKCANLIVEKYKSK